MQPAILLFAVLIPAIAGKAVDPPAAVPRVGTTWGPISTSTGILADNKDSPKPFHIYYDSADCEILPNPFHVYYDSADLKDLFHDSAEGKDSPRIKVVDTIVVAGTFKNPDDMHAYVQSQVTDDDAVIQVKPEKLQQLQGKYLEVLTLRPITHDEIKMVCHSYRSMPVLCHKPTNPRLSYAYSMVRDVETGETFPTAFSTHQAWHSMDDVGADPPNTSLSHINELVVLDKKVFN